MYKFFKYAIILLAFASCTSFEYENSYRVPDAKWALSDTLKFDVFVNDTVGQQKLYIKLKHTEAYTNANLWLFVQINAPNGIQITDTLELQLADHRGKWYGKKWFGEYRLLHPYKQGKVFEHPGTYQFNVVHGMRKDTVLNLVEIGLAIK